MRSAKTRSAKTSAGIIAGQRGRRTVGSEVNGCMAARWLSWSATSDCRRHNTGCRKPTGVEGFKSGGQ
ncbi:hypothetical protein I547_4552 [Mycobacterium kansasii 824]|uniref:Uncharacterized protein n=1 Tax=Mycobacterium kansasii TaxID=1768 RepID=A0A1V3WNN4_MYCKA|nr:hypothetical protein I547_4552 [Mycobacterium kansasii 824]OOK68046.1 hypothetical protein BZL29_7011 [Mycobacterium kansasii]OOK72169.1 hypothetical protein BZL30_5444 [Mycobacterium kansasii]